ncbi:MAG: hypothetical protein QM790_15995 [Nibricoccus sp.]
MPYSIMSPRRINRALRRLAELADSEKVALEIALCHGQIITVVYAVGRDQLSTSKAVESSTRAAALVRQVASEQRLPADWLEEDVKFYLALTAARGQPHLQEFGPSLVLSLAEPEHLLAMKLHICQGQVVPATADRHDLAFLIEKAGLDSVDSVESTYARFFPEHKLADDARAMVTRLLPASV